MPKNAPAANILTRLSAPAERSVAPLLEPEELASAVPVALTAWLWLLASSVVGMALVVIEPVALVLGAEVELLVVASAVLMLRE
jgi:hypothetical protein